MPSVKRPIPDNVKPYAAKLTSLNKPPIYNYKAPFQGSLQQDDLFGIGQDGGAFRGSQSQLGMQQMPPKHMKSMSSDPFMKTADKFQKSMQQQRDISPSEMFGGISQQDTYEPPGMRPQTSTDAMTGGQKGSSSIGKSVSNPQFTTLNMAPYSRPQTQAFGFRNNTMQRDPSKKQARASEEVTSITGVKNMTPLGPAAMNRPKTTTQDLLKKRSQSNKALKRRIIGGQTNADDKKKMLIDRLNQEDEDRKNDIFNNSPHRKPNEKIIAGTTENTDEILRQHFLMAKIRKQTDGKVIQRPSTSDLVYNFDNVKIPNLAGGGDNMRQYSASLNFRGAVRPQSQTNSKFGGFSKSPFNAGKSQLQDQIDEHEQEDDQNDELSPQFRQQSQMQQNQQQLDITKSDKVITHFGKTQGGTNNKQGTNANKWNDLDKLITLLQNQPDDDGYFIYLKPSEVGDPYDLQPLIEAEQQSKNSLGGAISKKSSAQQKTEKFFTLSKKGITTYISDEPVEYISLTDWLIERNFFQQISDKKFFKQFRKWKIIRMWRRNILQKKREEVKNNLQEKLFFLDDVFGPILRSHRRVCKEMEDLRIIDLNQPGHEAFSQSEFASNQDKKREDVVNRISETSDMCRVNFRKGIDNVLEELRQKINDQNEDEETHKKEYMRGGQDEGGAKEKKTLNSDPVFEQLGFKHNLKYGPRSKLRRACSRFLRFSYLLDFLALDALSSIYIESVKDTILKLKRLANLKVDCELRSGAAQFGVEQTKKPQQSVTDPPFFAVSGIFEEIDIPSQFYVKDWVEKFLPPPDGDSKEEHFDPTVHLEIKEQVVENFDEVDGINLLDEEVTKIERTKVRSLNKLWLNITPQKNDFASLINECFQEGLECLKHFERWSRHEDLLPYVKVLESWDDKVCDEWDPPDDNNLNCDDWLQQNPLFQNQGALVNEQLQEAFNKIFEFFELMEPYLLAYWENKQLNFAMVEDPKLNYPTEVISLLIKRFDDQKANFEYFIPEKKDLGMISISFKDIKSHLIPNPTACHDTLRKMLPAMVRTRILEFKNWLLAQIQAISSEVTNVETYVAQLQALDYIENNYQGVKDKIELNVQIYHICVATELEGKEDKKKRFVDEVYTTINQLNQAMVQANDSSDKKKDSMKSKIQAKIPKLKLNVDKFMQTIMQDRYLDINQNIYDILNEIDDLEKTCNKLVTKSKKIEEFEKTLAMENTRFDNVENAKQEMTFRAKLWRALREWTDLVEKWEGAFFDQIQVDEIEAKADLFTKIVVQCERQLPPTSTAVKHLKRLVFDFRETMPIVGALGNKNLQPEHWDDIKDVLSLDREFPLQLKQFKLSELIKFRVADFQEDLINISTTATQEFKLKEDLAKLKQTWFDQVLHTIVYKDVFILTSPEIIQEELDDSLTSISNIIGSRYVKRLQADAEEMQEKLNLIFETLEQWMECQRNWLYLDNIFASADIKRNRSKEYAEFVSINTNWCKLMKAVHQKPHIKQYTLNRVKLGEFQKYNNTMENIQKSLEDYLEEKRKEFPRFYFLSNDELLQILANASHIRKVIQQINKCFDNINTITVNDQGVIQPELLAMISSEREEVPFLPKFIKVKTGMSVETWMKLVEDGMITTVTKNIQASYQGYQGQNRKDWVLQHFGQPIAVVAQLTWTEATEFAINEMEADPLALQDHLVVNKQQLMQLTELVRGELPDVKRRVLVSLITTDLHNRDIIENLCTQMVESTNDFNWLQQLRYSQEEEKVQIRQVNAQIEYGYEYMGATSRLVITPLTDRCWITITGAMHINLGAAPAGPAGTGKTESTKDLAKALGIYCVVFNCSDQIEYKMMARLFSGLAQSGAWACLDEFNRIDVEVLSVIAQQLQDIKEAKVAGKTEFLFNASEVPILLKKGCGVFVTMNPGYAGRTELPDNLKVLFRPVSMMIPAYGLIAEIMLQAEGFEDAKNLSTKMVQLYKLASEQLSQQDHYDFGMRAVKSVLVMAGTLKRANPTLNENVVLIRAMRDSNIPKFLADDLPLFSALIQDLFPGVLIPEANFGELQEQIEQSLVSLGYQKVPEFIDKAIQLFDTFNVRFGVMIVGPTGAGKSTCYKVLADAMTKLRNEKNCSDERYQEVKFRVLNPKSITMGELYGEENADTKEWTDGLASKIIRKFGQDDSQKRNWCVFDGPVDALWIENMNTVLDDNLTLCLANGERIKLKWTMRMLFEVQDLSVASPATVSRCGMVYMTPSDLGWKPYLQSWLNRYLRQPDFQSFVSEDAVQYLEDQFNFFVDMGFEKIKLVKEEEALRTVPIQVVTCMCNFLEYFIKNKNSLPQGDKKECERKLNYYFGFAFIWSFGLSYKQSGVKYLDNMLREYFNVKLHFNNSETVFEYFYSEKDNKVVHWDTIVPQFQYDPKIPFFSLVVPTVDTVRYTTILDMLVQINKPVFFTGNTGVGKSIIVQKYIQSNSEKQGLAPILFNFSAQTTSLSVQKMIEEKLKKRGNKVLFASGNQTCTIFIDDVNMPMVEKYGAQPPIELLRQILDIGGFYDRPAFYKKYIEKFIVICAAAPPGGGRSALTPRFMRRFHIMCVPDPSEYSMTKIFVNIIEKFLSFNNFNDKVRNFGSIAVQGTIELYTSITENLLPIPAKFHYTFNLRDVAKVFQGILMTKSVSINSTEAFSKLWIHECSRVFYDRLINEEDRDFFRDVVLDLIKGRFKLPNMQKEEIFGKGSIIFSMLLRLDSEDKLYEEILDKNKLFKTLEDRLTDFNLSTKNKMDLVFFDDAISHICRISRILRQPRGNAMLIGVSGCGKQSLTKLSSFMLEYQCYQIKLSKNYKPSTFKDNLKVNMLQSGCDAIPNTFLMTDTQIINETFLEDLNNILNTGEISNYLKEDKDRMGDSLTKIMQQLKRPVNPDYIYQFYIERLRDNFHIILCMSPVGDQLRIRCRKFPSLVNCCTLDWFDNWPEDALKNVSDRFIQNLDNMDEKVKGKLSEMFTSVHKSVEVMSDRFYEELRRKVYITPKSYLDGINLFLGQLGQKRKDFKENIGRLSNGILKLQATNEQIADLKIKLTNLQPKLEIENKNALIQAEQIRESKAIAGQKEIETEQEAAAVHIESQKIEHLKKEAEVELAKAKPALEDAERACNELTKEEITNLKSISSPIPIVETVLKVVLIYLENPKTDWDAAKKVMTDIKFVDRLRNYQKDKVSQAILNKVKPYVTKDEFNPDNVTPKNRAAGGMARWCRAIREYAEALKIVQPKEAKLKEMSERYQEAMKIVEQKQRELFLIKEKLNKLEEEYKKTEEYIEQLDADKDTCERRLRNAGKLLELLGDEGERWKDTVEELYKEEGKLNGNVFIAAASISYIGPFTGLYREKLIEQWKALCFTNRIAVSDKYSLVNTLGNPIEIRDWGLCGLPSDSVSIDNGILATKTQRWPLMIDPQTQANTWIKKMYKDKGLKVLKLQSSEDGQSYQKAMESCIITGQTVLIEDVYQEIDPGLDSVLTKAIYKEEGVEKINFGDRPIMYDRNFRLFITTKLPNPHFLPEICIKLTVINFTVTFEGLEEQLLVDVVINEAPDVEVRRDLLVINISRSKNELKRLESLILSDLANSNQDTILDNVKLIETLEISKTNSISITKSLIEAEEVEKTINETRNSYKDVSVRGSILYFVIADLAGVDPMYQNSLMYVKKLFNDAIKQSEPCDTLQERITVLENSITRMLYINICRGLFEAHKLIYSFLICTSIKRKSKSINEVCWNFLLRGAGLFNKNDQPPRPEGSSHFITEAAWNLAYCLQVNAGPVFEGFCTKIKDNINKWEAYTIDEEEYYLENIPCGYGESMQLFEKLLILKIFKPEKLMFACAKYVEKELGRVYAESPIATMDALFIDSDNKTPIIFVLSQGADPTQQVIQFAHKMDFYDRFQYKSLGQGQEELATKMINLGKQEGNWVLLQNCHLFKSWMPALEGICERFQEEDKIHPDFRLIMTSMPADYFPVAILQNGLKMTTEPPRGVKANLKRSYNSLVTEELYNAMSKNSQVNVSSSQAGLTAADVAPDNSEVWRRLLFGLCFFHSTVQERRKFGPLGWNIRYEFNDSDLDTSIKMLKNFLIDAQEVPWDAMTYMTGQINYGGRVTDDWDRILLLNILKKFYTDDILTENYSFSQSGIYFVPTHTKVEEIQQYIEELPLTEEPEVFGMHQNANIAYQQQESEKILFTILNVQPRIVSGVGGKSSDDIIFELATELQANQPFNLDKEDHAKEIFKINSKGLLHCLSTVLLQEIEKYNKLLTKMTVSLSLLIKAIKGLVIMSPELDLMYSALLKNQVPPNWQEVSYPSLKPLASWVKDLSLRVEFMRNWLKTGHPHCYWLSGFFFPHGFMTGALQTFARKHIEAIDLLEFSFKIMDQQEPTEITKAPEDGIYVYGLFIEGARWSFEDKCLEEQKPGEMSFQMPLIHFLPIKKKQDLLMPSPDKRGANQESDSEDYKYKCPCYKTSVRAGILSTTGQSTNFILAIDLPCSENEPPEHWTCRGTALLSMLND